MFFSINCRLILHQFIGGVCQLICICVFLVSDSKRSKRKDKDDNLCTYNLGSESHDPHTPGIPLQSQ